MLILEPICLLLCLHNSALINCVCHTFSDKIIFTIVVGIGWYFTKTALTWQWPIWEYQTEEQFLVHCASQRNQQCGNSLSMVLYLILANSGMAGPHPVMSSLWTVFLETEQYPTYCMTAKALHIQVRLPKYNTFLALLRFSALGVNRSAIWSKQSFRTYFSLNTSPQVQ